MFSAALPDFSLLLALLPRLAVPKSLICWLRYTRRLFCCFCFCFFRSVTLLWYTGFRSNIRRFVVKFFEFMYARRSTEIVYNGALRNIFKTIPVTAEWLRSNDQQLEIVKPKHDDLLVYIVCALRFVCVNSIYLIVLFWYGRFMYVG